MVNTGFSKNRIFFAESVSIEGAEESLDCAQPSVQKRKRLFIDVKTSMKERIKIIKWAAENNYNTLVFSLGEKINVKSEWYKLAKHCCFFIEAGGRDLSLLLPRRFFLFHCDLFRMEQGRRKSRHHFCSTNPMTASIIVKRARYLFSRAMPAMTVPRVFHLLPDEGQENTWCACPACRAFNPAEQNLIAINSAADALAQIDPAASLSFFDYGTEPEAEGIAPRKNTFRLVPKTMK